MEHDQNVNQTQWIGTINDFSKTIISLSSGLLVGSAALVGTAITSFEFGATRIYLFISWFFFILSLVFGLLTTTSVINYQRKKGKAKKCILFANATYLSFVAAVLVFLIVGVLVIFD